MGAFLVFVSFVWIKQTGHNLWKTSQELRHQFSSFWELEGKVWRNVWKGIPTPPVQKLSNLNCCFIGFPPSRVVSEILRSLALTNSICIILPRPLLCYSCVWMSTKLIVKFSTYLLKACWTVTFNIPELFRSYIRNSIIFLCFSSDDGTVHDVLVEN